MLFYVGFMLIYVFSSVQRVLGHLNITSNMYHSACLEAPALAAMHDF
jgi:hypothetical protein